MVAAIGKFLFLPFATVGSSIVMLYLLFISIVMGIEFIAIQRGVQRDDSEYRDLTLVLGLIWVGCLFAGPLIIHVLGRATFETPIVWLDVLMHTLSQFVTSILFGALSCGAASLVLNKRPS